MSYKVKLELFEGPLDLLLYLVKKDHLNICDIPIAKVTEQYLQYLELMRLLDLNIAGEFLVMASTLIHVKSKMLLPPEPSQEAEQEEPDPRSELVKKLLEYQKFKEAAGVLRQKELLRQNVFTRAPASDKESQEVYFEASLFDLIAAFSKAMKEIPKELLYEVIKDEFTVEEKIHDLLHMLLNEPNLSVGSLFASSRNTFEVVVTFLAILELIRLKEVVIVQKELFGEIQVMRNQEKIEAYKPVLVNSQAPRRQELIKTQETDEDLVLNLSLRPAQLTDFVGQKELVENVRIAITAARERNEPLEHILFDGPPGLGKTSLAHIIAHEMSGKITATSGPAIERAGDLIGILTNLEKGDIFFIDEIHRLSKVVEEFLYPAMENFQIDFVIDKGPYAKTIKFNLKPFTLIGATTRQGLLSSPLRGRFGMFYHLDFYTALDLAKIIANSAKVLSVEVDAEGD